MESENFKKEILPLIPETAEKTKEKEKVFIVGSDLDGLGLSSRDLQLVLERLNQLHLEGKIVTVDQAREIAPKLDISELIDIPRQKVEKNEKIKPPRHTKKKGERY